METLCTSISPLSVWLLKTTLQGSLLICLIILIRFILGRRLLGKWSFCLWLILLVRLSLPWAPQSGLSLYNVVHPSRWMRLAPALTPVVEGGAFVVALEQSVYSGEVKMSEPALTPALLEAPSVEGRSTPSQFSGAAASLFVVWVSGVVILTGYVLARNLRFWRAIKGERPVTDQGILDLLEDGKMQMGVQALVGVIVTDKVRTPALFGFVRPRLLLPQGILEILSLDELHHVFLHELAHLKRRDIYFGWWIAMLQVLHWFNPLIWFALRRVRADQEIACDALVLSRMKPEDPPEYGRTMLRLLERFSQRQYLPSVAGLLEDASQIERRITMIAQYRKHSPRTAGVVGTIFILLAGTTLTNARTTHFDGLDEKVPSGLQKNLLVYYSFDRDGGTRAVDISGMDFHGVIQGAGYTEEGCLGGAMHFDGKDDSIRVAPEVSLKAFTIAAWVKTQTTSLNNRRVFMLDQGGEYFAFEGNSQGGTAFGIAGGSHDGAISVAEYDWRLQPGQWTHVAVTFTGTEARLYRDGVRTETGLVSKGRLTGTVYVGGVDAHNGEYWHGDIDELAVFNRALTDGELGQLYAMTGPQPMTRPVGDTAEPIAVWRFDGDARDSIGNNHGEVYGAMPTAGVSGQAYVFDGQDDNVVIRSVHLHSFSVSAWVKTEITSVNNRQIFVLTDGARCYSLQGNAGGGVGVDIAPDEEMNEYDWQFVVARWTHIVLTHDRRIFRIFKDGVLTQEGSIPTEGVAGIVYIGGSDRHDQGYWMGAIDEVVLWDRPLSQSEVRRLFDSYLLDAERVALTSVPRIDGFAGRWQGVATDKPEDGTSRDDLAVDLQMTGDGRMTGTATGDFVGSTMQSIENGRVQGQRLAFELRHRSGIRMDIQLQLQDEVLQGEGTPIDSDGDRCDITLERLANRLPGR